MNYKIFQLKLIEKVRCARQKSLETATRKVKDLSLNDYDLVWSEDLEVYEEDFDYLDFLNGVYRVFNIARPKGFKGHMLSISDIVELDGALYYVNPFGFVEIDRDFKKIRSLP